MTSLKSLPGLSLLMACSVLSFISSDFTFINAAQAENKDTSVKDQKSCKNLGKVLLALKGDDAVFFKTKIENYKCRISKLNLINAAIMFDATQSFKFLITAVEDSKFMPAVNLASHRLNLTYLNILEKEGFGFDAQSQDGSTALHLAAKANFENLEKRSPHLTADPLKIIEKLGFMGTSIRKRDKKGRTPLMVVRYPHVARQLLDMGIDPYAEDLKGKYAGHYYMAKFQVVEAKWEKQLYKENLQVLIDYTMPQN